MENQNYLSELENDVKNIIIEIIQKYSKLEFTWESGNDEAFIYFKKEYFKSDENKYKVEEYLLLELEIPDAGEFEMEGEGYLYIEKGYVNANYQSTMRGVIDYNEETGEEIWSEAFEKKDVKKLFSF